MGKLLTDASFVRLIEKQNALLEVMARDSIKAIAQDWKSLSALADDGLFGDVFNIGDQFVDTWKDTSTDREYTYPYRLNHIGNVQLADGETLVKRPFLQMHYAHALNNIQFSGEQAFLKCPNGLSAGTYYFTFGANFGTYIVKDEAVCFRLTKNVPAGGKVGGCYKGSATAKSDWRVYSYEADGKTIIETVVPTFTKSGTNLGVMSQTEINGNLNCIENMCYGNPRWSTSAVRQYLNSDKGIGQWWTPKTDWDIAPVALDSKPGFLTGCPEEFVNALKEVKVVTCLNRIQNPTITYDTTYDRVFLPSMAEMYFAPEVTGEGEVHEYWKRRSGSSTPLPSNTPYTQMITYFVQNHTGAVAVMCRSADMWTCHRRRSCNNFGEMSAGQATNTGASFSPIVVL